MDGLYYVFLWLGLIAISVISYLYTRRKANKNLLLITAVICFCIGLAMSGMYLYDAFILPNRGFHDGIPITGLMRIFLMDDDLTNRMKFTGVSTSFAFVAGTLAYLVFSITVYRRARMKNSAEPR